jgi:hypothetical protein
MRRSATLAQEALLVLDNVEHLLEGARLRISFFVAARCHGPVTSRSGSHGRRADLSSPVALVPGPGETPRRALPLYEGVRLSPTAQLLRSISSVAPECRALASIYRLDGIPLAIELAQRASVRCQGLGQSATSASPYHGPRARRGITVTGDDRLSCDLPESNKRCCVECRSSPRLDWAAEHVCTGDGSNRHQACSYPWRTASSSRRARVTRYRMLRRFAIRARSLLKCEKRSGATGICWFGACRGIVPRAPPDKISRSWMRVGSHNSGRVAVGNRRDWRTRRNRTQVSRWWSAGHPERSRQCFVRLLDALQAAADRARTLNSAYVATRALHQCDYEAAAGSRSAPLCREPGEARVGVRVPTLARAWARGRYAERSRSLVECGRRNTLGYHLSAGSRHRHRRTCGRILVPGRCSRSR